MKLPEKSAAVQNSCKVQLSLVSGFKNTECFVHNKITYMTVIIQNYLKETEMAGMPLIHYC